MFAIIKAEVKNNKKSIDLTPLGGTIYTLVYDYDIILQRVEQQKTQSVIGLYVIWLYHDIGYVQQKLNA